MQLLVISNICFSIGRGYAIVGDIQHLFLLWRGRNAGGYPTFVFL